MFLNLLFIDVDCQLRGCDAAKIWGKRDALSEISGKEIKVDTVYNEYFV
jgi:hypothetical protein